MGREILAAIDELNALKAQNRWSGSLVDLQLSACCSSSC